MSSKRRVFIGAGLGAMRRREIGAAMVEFAIILPVLLLFIAGILELGRLFGQMAWITRSSYETTYLAGSVNSDDSTGRNGIAKNRMDLFYGLMNKDVHPDYTVQTVNGPSDGLVTVTFVGNRNGLLNMTRGWDLGANLSIVGPQLLPRPGNTGALAVFNDAPVSNYDCSANDSAHLGCACHPADCNDEYRAADTNMAAINRRKYDIYADLSN